MNITAEKAAEKIKKAKNIILLSHTNPDGDTVGSVCALAYALTECQKKVTCLCDSDIPERLRFICGDLYKKDCALTGDELIISVDVASPEMLGALSEKFAPLTKIRIDHHKKGSDFAEFNLVDSDASSAGEIVFEILSILKLTSCQRAISALYASIASDTGCFKYANTTAKTHMIAAYLISLGADHSEINEALFENLTLKSLEIYPLFLKNLKTLYSGRVNLVNVTNDEKASLGLVDSDLEELSSLSRQLNMASLGIVLRQKDGTFDTFKVSMRSRKGVNCSNIASYLGGGGHIRAAGATIKASNIEEAEKILLEALEKTLCFEE